MHHKPLKKFGQNFLTQPLIAEKIIQAININSTDHILEIGPGTGILTSIIINKRPARFTAVEIDRNLAGQLHEKYPDRLNLLQEDFLNIDLSGLSSPGKLKIIGNIPYNITSPILFKMIDHFKEIGSAVLMMQKEVAKRIVAEKSTKDYGILSVILQTFASVDYLFEVGRNNFSPVPGVDSAVVRMNFIHQITDVDNMELYRKIVRAVFNYRRKMLRNSLIRIFGQSIVTSLYNFDLTRRPEEFSISDFKKLANSINKMI